MSDEPVAGDSVTSVPPAILLLAAGNASAALTRALEAAGCTADTAQDPRELAASPGSRRYDAVVVVVSAADLIEKVERALAGVADRPLVVVVGKSGGRHPHLVDLEVAPDDAAAAARQIAGAVSALRLKLAEAEIERLRKAVLFARQTAHDLAQPLTTILARAQLLRLSAKPEDPHHRAVNIICDEADRLAKMMEEFQKLKVMSQRPAS